MSDKKLRVTVSVRQDNEVTNIEVDGLDVAGVPGLVLTRPVYSNGAQSIGWSLTHMPSGLRIGPTWMQKRQAIRLAKLIAPYADWTKSAASIKRLPAAKRAQLRVAIKAFVENLA